MTETDPAAAPALTREQRQILDYIGEMSLELSSMATRAGFMELSAELAQSSVRARDIVHLARAGVDPARP